MPSTNLTPLKDLKVLTHHIPAHSLTPNTSLQHKPLLIYKSAFRFPSGTTLNSVASTIESHLSTTGVVVPQWRYTMYSTSHFHSTSHEVLAITHGRARLCFGHEDNPDRVMEEVGRGDVIVLPAGVAHRLWEDLDGGFEMVGSYPKGCGWDMCYGRQGEEHAWERIKGLRWFGKDPVYGDQGPVFDV